MENIIKEIVNQHFGIIKEVIEAPSEIGLPQIFRFIAVRKSFKNLKLENKMESYSNGFGYKFNKKEAFMAAVGEAIERYASTYIPSDLTLDDFDNLSKKNKVQNINEFYQYRDTCSNYKKIPDSKPIRWTLGKELGTNIDVFLPASLIYLPYPFKEEIIREEISTGLACGTSLEMALYNALCECIERDSFGLSWYSKNNSSALDLKLLCNKENYKIVTLLKEYGIDVILRDTTSDLNIPSYSLTLINKILVPNRPLRYVALKSGFDFNKILYSLLGEALGGYMALGTMYKENHPIPKTISDIIKLEDNALYYGLTKNKEEIKLIENISNIQTKVKHIDNISYKQGIDLIIENCRKQNIKIFFKDVSTEDIKKCGLHVIKVISPDLFYLNNKSLCLKNKRLQKLLKGKDYSTTINHPFS